MAQFTRRPKRDTRVSNLVFAGVPTAIPVALYDAVFVELQADCNEWIPVAAPPADLLIAASDDEVLVEFAHGPPVGRSVMFFVFLLPLAVVALGGTTALLLCLDPRLCVIFASSGADNGWGPPVPVLMALALVWGAVACVFLYHGVSHLQEALYPERHLLTLRPDELEYAVSDHGCRRRKAEANSITVSMQRKLVASIVVVNLPGRKKTGPRRLRRGAGEANESRICVRTTDDASCCIDLSAGPAQRWLLTLLQNWHVINKGGI